MFPEFTSVFDEVSKNDKIKSIVIMSGKTNSFVAGADIVMLQSCKNKEEIYTLSREGQRVFDLIENSDKPIVSAIMGTCLGGGLEIALATHYRIAVNDKKTVLGLPEVKLGLLPGSGGTQRLPRLVSLLMFLIVHLIIQLFRFSKIPLPDALDMMLTGKNIRANKAKKMGLVDALVEPLGPGLASPEERTLEYLEQSAIKTARKLANDGVPERKKNLMRSKCCLNP